MRVGAGGRRKSEVATDFWEKKKLGKNHIIGPNGARTSKRRDKLP